MVVSLELSGHRQGKTALNFFMSLILFACRNYLYPAHYKLQLITDFIKLDEPPDQELRL